MSRDLGAYDLSGLSWVLNGYTIVYASLLVLFGRLAERQHRERGFLLGVAVFTVASAGNRHGFDGAAIRFEALPRRWRGPDGWKVTSRRMIVRSLRLRWPDTRSNARIELSRSRKDDECQTSTRF
jgi:hypothetical protein